MEKILAALPGMPSPLDNKHGSKFYTVSTANSEIKLALLCTNLISEFKDPNIARFNEGLGVEIGFKEK